jgi:hypothetical protein
MTEGETIGWAVKQMLNGQKVRRAGWNAPNLWIAHQPASIGDDWLGYAYMSTAQGNFVPWSCSQADLFATDWELAQ